MNHSESKPHEQFPPGITFILASETAERFSFYGLKAILALYLLSLFAEVPYDGISSLSPEVYGPARQRSVQWTHMFMATMYAFPVIGGALADRVFGRFRLILWVSLLYCAGHGVLAVAAHLGVLGAWEGARLSMALGLALIAAGAGGIKPCVSATVGDQFGEGQSVLVNQAYQAFYFVINFGSFFATLLVPQLLRRFGPEVAFGVPGVLMAIATVIFWSGRRRFRRVAPAPGGWLGMVEVLVITTMFAPVFAALLGLQLWEDSQSPTLWDFFLDHWWLLVGTIGAMGTGVAVHVLRHRLRPEPRPTGILQVVRWSWRNRRDRRPGEGFFGPARRAFGEDVGDGPTAVFGVAAVLSMVTVFWALFDQHSSTWVLQAERMNLTFHAPGWFSWTALGLVVVGAVGALVALLRGLSNRPIRAVWFGRAGILAASLLVLAGTLDVWGPPMGRRSVLCTVAAHEQQVDELRVLAGEVGADPTMKVVVREVDTAQKGIFTARIDTPTRESLYGTYERPEELRDALAQVRARLDGEPRPRWLLLEFDASQTAALNPLLVMLIVPGLHVLVYGPLRRRGLEVPPLRRMAVGMFLAAGAFALSALLQGTVDAQGPGEVWALWQLGQYVVLTVAEVLVSVTGLEFAYTHAPRAMKSTIASLWYLTTSLGNLLVVGLAPLQEALAPAGFLWLFSGLMVGAAGVFVLLASRFRGRVYLQDVDA